MTDKKITRRQVRHPRDFGDRELFKRTFSHWIPSEKIDALYSELQGDFKKVCELSIEELKHYGLTQRDAIAFLSMLELLNVQKVRKKSQLVSLGLDILLKVSKKPMDIRSKSIL